MRVDPTPAEMRGGRRRRGARRSGGAKRRRGVRRIEPAARGAKRRARRALKVARVGFEPTSRAHEAREEAAPPPRKSGRLESNQRSPVPETGGVATSPTASRKNPRRDSNPRFRIESPASSPPRPRGHASIGGPGVEPGPARYQRAVPPRTLTSERLRRQDSNLSFASNSRASCRLDHAGTKGGGSRDRTCGRG
jgi:hypothetical protein